MRRPVDPMSADEPAVSGLTEALTDRIYAERDLRREDAEHIARAIVRSAYVAEAMQAADDWMAARVTAAVLTLCRRPNERLSRAGAPVVSVADLRGAVSSTGTEALDRERAKAWDEGFDAGQDERPRVNPYRADADRNDGVQP